MTKIYCADVTCKFCNSKGVCTQGNISLSFHSVMTLWDGRQSYNKCKSYEKSQTAVDMEQKLKDLGIIPDEAELS